MQPNKIMPDNNLITIIRTKAEQADQARRAKWTSVRIAKMTAALIADARRKGAKQ